MLETNFQYYGGDIRFTKPLGYVSLERFLNAIQKPKPKLKEVFMQIREATNGDDKVKKDELKRKLNFVTPCAAFHPKRKYDNIIHFTKLLVVDFDKLEPSISNEMKHELFKEYSYILAAWLSVSGSGLRALIEIPRCQSVHEFKEYFEGVKSELGGYIGWDNATQNPALPLFLSYDEDILVRDNNTIFTNKVIIDKTPEKKYDYSFVYNNDYTEQIPKIVKGAINKIHDNGHPQLRAIAYALGGYVADGHITEQNAIALIHSCIDGNNYLSRPRKNESNFTMANVYKQTAIDSIKAGKEFPLSPK